MVDCDGRGVSLEGGGGGRIGSIWWGGGAGCVVGIQGGRVGWYCKRLEGRMDGEVFVRDEGKVR